MYRPTWKKISLLKESIHYPKPILILKGNDEKPLNVNLHTSISHEGHNTIAIVLASVPHQV